MVTENLRQTHRKEADATAPCINVKLIISFCILFIRKDEKKTTTLIHATTWMNPENII